MVSFRRHITSWDTCWNASNGEETTFRQLSSFLVLISATQSIVVLFRTLAESSHYNPFVLWLLKSTASYKFTEMCLRSFFLLQIGRFFLYRWSVQKFYVFYEYFVLLRSNQYHK